MFSRSSGLRFRLSSSSFIFSPSAKLLCSSSTRSSSSSPAAGHEVTVNGFGVMMSNPLKDIFVKKWTEDTLSRMRPSSSSKSLVPFVSSLEVGCAFGAASLNLMKEATSLDETNNNEKKGKSLYLTANDLEHKHLKKLLSRYENWIIEQKKTNPNFKNPNHQLRTWPGRVPDIFEQQNKLVESSLAPEQVSSLTKFDTILIANVLHFLTPDEIHQTLSFLYKNHAVRGTKLYISLDSPFTAAYRRGFILPLYYNIKKNLFKSKSPGYTSKRVIKRRFVQKRIPERLKGMECYHVMEPDVLERFVKEAGWSVDVGDVDGGAQLFAGDDEGNPKGVSLNGKEMVGICCVKK